MVSLNFSVFFYKCTTSLLKANIQLKQITKIYILANLLFSLHFSYFKQLFKAGFNSFLYAFHLSKMYFITQPKFLYQFSVLLCFASLRVRHCRHTQLCILTVKRLLITLPRQQSTHIKQQQKGPCAYRGCFTPTISARGCLK